MFTSWVDKCKAEAGFSEASDTRKKQPDLSDKMASESLVCEGTNPSE